MASSLLLGLGVILLGLLGIAVLIGIIILIIYLIKKNK